MSLQDDIQPYAGKPTLERILPDGRHIMLNFRFFNMQLVVTDLHNPWTIANAY